MAETKKTNTEDKIIYVEAEPATISISTTCEEYIVIRAKGVAEKYKSDGTIERKYPDGKIEIIYPDETIDIIEAEKEKEAETKKTEEPNNYIITKTSGSISDVKDIVSGLGDKKRGSLGELLIQQGNLTVKVKPDFIVLVSFGPITYQFLEYVIEEANKQGFKSPVLEISIDEYRKKRGLSDTKSVRESIIQTIVNLHYSIIVKPVIKYDTKNEPYVASMRSISIIQEAETPPDLLFKQMSASDAKRLMRKQFLKNGKAIIHFSEPFFKELKEGAPMPLSADYLTIDSRANPNSVLLLRKIHEFKFMNIGKPNEDIIKIKTLLKHSTIPTLEEVKNSGRQIYQRIIKPFIRDLEALNCFDITYLKADNTPFKNDELLPNKINVDEFLNGKIKIEWINYPNEQKIRTDKINERKAITAKVNELKIEQKAKQKIQEKI